MGIVWKARVDAAMQLCKEIGTLADDYRACEAKAQALQPANERATDVDYMLQRSAARRLGAHYLMRYSLLIVFRSYYHTWLTWKAKGDAASQGRRLPAFHTWFDERKELHHLLTTLQLDE